MNTIEILTGIPAEQNTYWLAKRPLCD